MAALSPQDMRDRADAIDAIAAAVVADLVAKNFAGASLERQLQIDNFVEETSEHADSWRQAAEIVSRLEQIEITHRRQGGAPPAGGPYP